MFFLPADKPTFTCGAIELKRNRACLSNYSIPKNIQDRSHTVH